MSVCFSMKYGRFEALDCMLKWAVEKYLYLLSCTHLAAGRRQVVTFSFDLVSRNVDLFGVYDAKELSALIAWLRREAPEVFNGAVVDIGANIGNHSLYFADHFQKIYSFEPNERTFRVLEMNASLVSNIECFELGLSDIDGKALLMAPVGHLGCSRIVAGPGSNTNDITVTRLDSISDRFENVRMIKIDVEGHEYEVLQGGEKLIRASMPHILFEQQRTDFDIRGDTRVLGLLRSYGYAKFAVIREYPRLSWKMNSRLRRVILGILRLIYGTEIRVVVGEVIEPDFYPFIIAIPG